MQPRRFKFFISVVFVLFAASSFGQKSEKQIGLGTGWYYHRFKDASISATSQTGGSMSLLLFFRANGLKNRHHVQLLYAEPSLRSTYLLAREQPVNIQYAYHRKIATIKEIIFFGGIVTDINLLYSRYSEMGNSHTYSNPYKAGEMNCSFSPSLLIEIPLSKNKISVQAWRNIAGYVYIFGVRDIRGVVDINDFSSAGIRVSYNQNFSERWAGRIEYQTQYWTKSKKEDVTSIAQQVNFSLVYKFH
jgi:hypothetical protein